MRELIDAQPSMTAPGYYRWFDLLILNDAVGSPIIGPPSGFDVYLASLYDGGRRDRWFDLGERIGLRLGTIFRRVARVLGR